MKKLFSSFYVLAPIALISACGGSGGGSGNPSTPAATNRAPVFNSVASISVEEETSGSFTSVRAIDADGDAIAYSISGGDDAMLFMIDSLSGSISFLLAPDFELPGDANTDNLYDVEVTASDGEDSTSLTLEISVTNVMEGGTGSGTTPAEIAARFGLDPSLPPGENFDLLSWYLNTPEEDPSDGLSIRIDEDEMDDFVDPDYFYTAEDGGMVFIATNAGAKTSANTSFTRTELREMLRRGDTSISTRNGDGTPNLNNWVFSSAPQTAQDAAGGVDGNLRATLAVNAVTTTGSSGRVGRVIVGQIHAKDDEPIRLYYRKLPGNELGSVYAAHELSEENSPLPNAGDDIWYEILGSRDNNATNPVDGIALDEIWSYEIEAQGNELTVIIRSDGLDGDELGRTTIDMSDSGYDVANEFMYFKAGAYNQNNEEDGGAPDDFVQVTFYELENTHD